MIDSPSKIDRDDRSPWQRACDEAREAPTSGPIQDAHAVAIEAAERLLAYARSMTGDGCPSCQGYGTRVYPTTATWHGGAGGATPTLGVCDRCWRSGLVSRKGPNLREAARVSDALRQETRLSLALTEQRDAAIAERDEARAETARLASQLESITAENHSRAQRESQSLEDWAALRAEVESLKAQLDLAHKFHDVAVKERDYYKTRLAHAEAEIEAIHNTHETKGVTHD